MTTIQIGNQQLQLLIRWASFPALARAFVGHDPVILALGLVGAAAAFRQRAMIPALVFVLGWGAFFMTNGGEHTRYLLPMAVLLALPAGFAVERFATSTPLRIAAGVLLLLPLVQALRLGAVLRQPDTRAAAEELLAELPEGARASTSTARSSSRRAPGSRRRTACVTCTPARPPRRPARGGDGSTPGVDAFRIEDAMLFDLRHRGSEVRQLPPASTGRLVPAARDPGRRRGPRRLGATHVLLVDRTLDDGRPPLLIDPEPSLPNEFDGPGAPPVPKLRPLAVGPALWRLPGLVRPGDARRRRGPRRPPPGDLAPARLRRVQRPGPALSLHALSR